MSTTINPKNLKKDNICKNNTDEDDLAVLKHENKTEKKSIFYSLHFDIIDHLCC